MNRWMDGCGDGWIDGWIKDFVGRGKLLHLSCLNPLDVKICIASNWQARCLGWQAQNTCPRSYENQTEEILRSRLTSNKGAQTHAHMFMLHLPGSRINGYIWQFAVKNILIKRAPHWPSKNVSQKRVLSEDTKFRIIRDIWSLKCSSACTAFSHHWRNRKADHFNQRARKPQIAWKPLL